MSEQDAAEKQAEDILARFPDNWSPSHREICAAVDASLRAKDAELETARVQIKILEAAVRRLS